MKFRNFVKKGQVYQSKDQGIKMRVLGKDDGTRWKCVRLTKSRKAVHSVAEGTLIKYYVLVEEEA